MSEQRVIITSEEFTTRRGLADAWTQIRGDVLVAHGIPRDRKRVNVKAGMIRMEVRIARVWLKYTDDRSTMCDRVDQGGEGAAFRLTAPIPVVAP